MKINGITLFPFIILKNSSDKYDEILINHEKIHLRQQLELLVFIFYIWYVLEYCYWLVKLKNPFDAYKAISFEREAYAMETDMNYLKSRKFCSFLQF